MPEIHMKALNETCPMCGKKYVILKGILAPTCGHPNCIREARAAGLPFTAPSQTTLSAPRHRRKRTAGKK